MEKSIRQFSKQVQDRLEVLRASLSDLDKDEGAEGSLRRVARSISSTAEEFGLTHIQKWARLAEAAGSRPDLISGVQGLISSLQELQEQASAAHASILIVDDDPTFVLLLESMLKAPDREIVSAGTAAEAMALLESQAFDLLVLDLMLPDADGRDFLLRVRETPASGGMHVIVASGLRATHAKAECLALGADDYLEKPVESELARSVVAGQLAGIPGRKRGTLADPGTGVGTRSALFRAFEAEKAEDPQGESPLALARLSLHAAPDDADTRSRKSADPVLNEFAQRISGFLGESGYVAADPDGRILVLFPGMRPEEAIALLTEAGEELARAEDPGSTDHCGETLTFSGAVVDVSGEEDLREGIARADRLLSRVMSQNTPRTLMEGQPLESPSQTILLVEDDRVTAALIKHRLEKDGFEVAHYYDGQAGYKAVEEGGAFALAIVDVKLPGMDGFELLQRVRELRHSAKLPVIMLTSMGREADIVRGFELGANDYVLKPFSSVELLARIHRSLGA